MKQPRATKVNAGNTAWYRKKLTESLKRLKKRIQREIDNNYHKSATKLTETLNRLASEWEKDFNSEALANSFTLRVNRATTSSMKNALQDCGLKIQFRNTRSVQKVLTTIRDTQIDLIKSIPSEQLDRVSSIVRQGILNGRDLYYIRQELVRSFAISERRARMIAIDQSNKATEAIKRVRDLSLGITEGVWVHIAGRKTSRKTHVAMHGKRFKLHGEDAGIYDSAVGEYVLPGQLINCQCSYRAIIPELTELSEKQDGGNG